MFSFKSTARLALLVLALPLAATAQRVGTNYTMVSAGGGVASYAALAPTSAAATLTAGSPDDGFYNNIPLGFSFNFGGVLYNSVSASTNGFIVLGQALNTSFPTNNLTSSSVRPVIAPLWDDLSFTTVSSMPSTAPVGGLYYQTTGSPGSRTFTIEWRDVRWSPGALGPVLSMLVQLNEGSGIIAFDYLQGGTSAYGSTRSASVGFAGAASGDFLSLSDLLLAATTSSTVETSTITSRATSGRKYTFTPTIIQLASRSAEGLVSFQLAPNPANTEVRIVGNEAKLPVQLLDGLGKAVRIQPAGTGVLDLRGLAKGLYLVKVGQSSRRLVVD